MNKSSDFEKKSELLFYLDIKKTLLTGTTMQRKPTLLDIFSFEQIDTVLFRISLARAHHSCSHN